MEAATPAQEVAQSNGAGEGSPFSLELSQGDLGDADPGVRVSGRSRRRTVSADAFAALRECARP